jgi:dolichol kinase
MLRGMSGKTARKLWHLLGGSLFPISAFFVCRETLLIALSAVTFAFLTLELIRLLSPKVNGWFLHRFHGMLKEKEVSQPTSSSYLLISSLLAFLLFERDIAILSVLFLAIGDPAAATIGEKFRIWHGLKGNWQGYLACALSCLAVGGMVSAVGSDITLPLLLGGAIITATIELIPCPIDDNFLIPLLSGGAMTLIVHC